MYVMCSVLSWRPRWPEHVQSHAVLQLAEVQKRQQELLASKRSGAAGAAANQQWATLERNSRDLKAVLAIDGEEQRRLDSDSAKYLQIALTNYRRHAPRLPTHVALPQGWRASGCSLAGEEAIQS